MNPLLLLGLVGVGGYLLLKGGTSSNLAAAQAQANAAANAQPQYAAPGAFGSATALTPADLANAQSLGLTPQEYADAGLSGSASASAAGWAYGAGVPWGAQEAHAGGWHFASAYGEHY
jgi:hypothetical protein